MGIETHRFKDFTPAGMKYLLLGSFTSKDSRKGVEYDWYYSNGRNQFWPLIEGVYKLKLDSKESKMALFSKLRLGITDIIYKCNRTSNSSLDNALEVLEYNPRIPYILKNNLKIVFFSSRFVEDLFRKIFSEQIELYPETKFIYLPSPSPRYAMMSKAQKIQKYAELLPKLQE